MPLDGSLPALFVFDANRLKRGDCGLGGASSLLVFMRDPYLNQVPGGPLGRGATFFGVAGFANGIIEGRIGCALEDDYFFCDPTLPGELPTPETMEIELAANAWRSSRHPCAHGSTGGPSAHRQMEPLTTRASMMPNFRTGTTETQMMTSASMAGNIPRVLAMSAFGGQVATQPYCVEADTLQSGCGPDFLNLATSGPLIEI